MSPNKKIDIKNVLDDLEWREVATTLQAAISEMLDERDTPTPKPPPPTPVPDVPESSNNNNNNINHQPANPLSGGCCRCVPLRAAPHYFNEAPAPNVFVGHTAPIMDQGLLYGPPPMWSCVMYNQGAGYNPPLHNNMPVLILPTSTDHSLNPLGYMNGQVFYKLPAGVFAPPDFGAQQTYMYFPNFPQRINQKDENRPYVKKPLNAFMIFRKEQRPIVMAEQKIRDSATVNAIVGQKWKRLTKEEQDRYYKEAEKERRLHALRHPDWSSKYNYGKSKLRNRKINSKAPTADMEADGECVTEPLTGPVASAAPNQKMSTKQLPPDHLAQQQGKRALERIKDETITNILGGI